MVAEQPDFDKRDAHGNLAVFATDLCRALATAVLGDVAGLQQQGYPDAPHGLQALHDGKLDVLYGVSPRDEWASFYRVAYGQPVFYDSQSVMAHAGRDGPALKDLAGKQICFIGNTLNEVILTRAMQARHIPFRPFPFQETGEMEAALVTGHCAAEATDASALADQRAGFHARQHDFVILPDMFAIDPYVPAVPANDSAWLQAVNAVFFALVQAEQNGITKETVAERRRSGTPDDQDFLDPHGSGAALGLPDGWVGAAIGTVGNYGQVFARDLGQGSPLRLSRGLNRLWSDGGLMWAAPD